MYKKILIFILFFLPANFALSAEQDIGIRFFDGKENIKISADDTVSVSPLRIYESGKIYAIPLVDLTDPMASSVRIDTKSGIKSLKKFGGTYPYKNKRTGVAFWGDPYTPGWNWSLSSIKVDNSYNILSDFVPIWGAAFKGVCSVDNTCIVTATNIFKKKTATVYLNPDGINSSSLSDITGNKYYSGWCNSLPSKPPVSFGEGGWWNGLYTYYEFVCIDNKFYPMKDACQSGAISSSDLRNCVDYKYPPTPAGS